MTWALGAFTVISLMLEHESYFFSRPETTSAMTSCSRQQISAAVLPRVPVEAILGRNNATV
ncbi:hypothetical protein [Mesorhizobium sp.]|uniref:hypothetical protein n=1 Tax=Mesorhizobium sp. TaxID=1871066 RepID=UPI00338F5181